MIGHWDGDLVLSRMRSLLMERLGVMTALDAVKTRKQTRG